MTDTVLWWVRRDLRLGDNQALAAALDHAGGPGGPGGVIPVFVLDPVLLGSPRAGEKRLAFLYGGLRRLDADLRTRGSRLIVRKGDPAAELAALLAETGARAIYAEEDYEPYARQRDGWVAGVLPLHLTGGLTVHPPGTVQKRDGGPYTVFTPFSRQWKARPLPQIGGALAAPERLPAVPAVPGLPVPEAPALAPEVPFPPGEAEARRRLRAFVSGDGAVRGYARDRDRMDLAGTSQLSPYLRFGMISAREAVIGALAAAGTAADAGARAGAEAWLNELIWREFYAHILYHFPGVLGESFRPNLRAVAWENDTQAFAAWCEGWTGYPVVDAAMRQLVQSGWMHNRARMIVASFLVKDLLIDWRWGERFFMEHLVDGDPAANNGGWQWSAGTGTDAAPYFRIFHPVLQGKKYDPGGAYVRRWLPELARVPDRYLHTPWLMPAEVQREAGCVLGREYAEPIVDHARARERVLAAYARAKQATGGG